MRIDFENLAAIPQRLEKFLHFIQLAESCDTNVEDTFRLANSLRNSRQMQACVTTLMNASRAQLKKC